MSGIMPAEVRDRIRRLIWATADRLSWAKLSDRDRAGWYENWSKDKEIGGVLSHYMDPRKVRVYIKDSLLKPYQRARAEQQIQNVMLSLGIDHASSRSVRSFNKPEGRQLPDGRIICWGNSRDWKSLLISVYERAYQIEAGVPYAAVFVESGQTAAGETREMIREIGSNLKVQRIEWLE